MRRSIIRVILAVVLSLTLLLGTTSYASAKPSMDVDEASMQLWDGDSDGDYHLSAVATVYGMRLAYYVVEWFWKDGSTWTSFGRVGKTLSTPGKVGLISLDGPDNLDSSYCGKEFMVKVYKVSKAFKVNERRGYASDAVTLNCTSAALYVEHFNGYTAVQPPPGWTVGGNLTDGIYVFSSDYAGGSDPELYFEYATSNTTSYTYYAYTPSINATSATNTLSLSFKHDHGYYTGEPPPVSPPYSIAVDVSTDGGATWGATSFVYSPTADIGPETVQVSLGAYKGNVINIRWSISGYTYWTNGWYIDDIIVKGS